MSTEELLQHMRPLAHLAEVLNNRQRAGYEITPLMWSVLHELTNAAKKAIVQAEKNEQT